MSVRDTVIPDSIQSIILIYRFFMPVVSTFSPFINPSTNLRHKRPVFSAYPLCKCPGRFAGTLAAEYQAGDSAGHYSGFSNMVAISPSLRI